jgi:molybdopterin molybdotransferase
MVLGFDEAIGVVLEHAAELRANGSEEVGLLAATGRVLAVAVVADRDQPPFDRSTRDGFAVRAVELGGALQVVGQLRAGEIWSGGPLESGTAVEIMTGAPMPQGADAVVMVEHVEQIDGAIRVLDGRGLRDGENVVPRGSEARAGQEVLRTGTVIRAAEIALAAACGQGTLTVFCRPKVAIVATGDELVELDQVPEPQQIRNSNSYALAALVAAAGGEAVRLAIAVDRREAISEAIEVGRQAELMVLSGGVSMGQYDLVEAVLGELGAEFFFTGVRMQPGKPVVFGRLPARGGSPAVYFFGLPGNPVSTQVTFHVFVETMIRALSGAGVSRPQFLLATLAEDVAGRLGLTRLLPAQLTGVEVRLVGWQGSGDLAANARANCYALLPADRESFVAGEMVRVLLR